MTAVSSKETSNPDLSSALLNDFATNIVFLPFPRSSPPGAPQNFWETKRWGLENQIAMLSSFLESFPRTPQAVRGLGERCREARKSQAMLSTFLPGSAPPSSSWVTWGTRPMLLLSAPMPRGSQEAADGPASIDAWEWGLALDRLALHESSSERLSADSACGSQGERGLEYEGKYNPSPEHT